MEWIQENYSLIFAILFGLSEVIALIPNVKANSVFQLIYNVLKTMAGKKEAM